MQGVWWNTGPKLALKWGDLFLILVLQTVDRFFLSHSPHLVQVGQELIDEILRQIISVLDLELISLCENFTRHKTIHRAVTILGKRIYISSIAPAILYVLSEALKLFGSLQQLDEVPIIFFDLLEFHLDCDYRCILLIVLSESASQQHYISALDFFPQAIYIPWELLIQRLEHGHFFFVAFQSSLEDLYSIVLVGQGFFQAEYRLIWIFYEALVFYIFITGPRL